LTSCGIDQDSTIIVWDWTKGKILAKSTGHQERVFDLQFNPYKENALVSCGIKQISFWNLIGNTLQKKKGIFGQVKDIQTMFCMAFSKEKEIYYTGTMNGQVYVWEGNQLKEIIPGVHNGSIFTMVAVEDGFITGGKDGKIRTWDASFSPIDTIDLVLLISEFTTPFNFIYNDGMNKIYSGFFIF
jgi:WD40 repeat protein